MRVHWTIRRKIWHPSWTSMTRLTTFSGFVMLAASKQPAQPVFNYYLFNLSSVMRYLYIEIQN